VSVTIFGDYPAEFGAQLTNAGGRKSWAAEL
jgi:hypothetical protein